MSLAEQILQFVYARLGKFFYLLILLILLILLRMGMVRALVLASVKSGKSVDNKKRVLSLAETRSHFILSTDFTDFTDFATRVLGYGLAALLGRRHLLDGLDSLDGLDGREVSIN